MNVKVVQQNRKTASIKVVSEDQILVKVPLFYNAKDIASFVEKNKNWIAQARTKIALMDKQRFVLENGVSILLGGENYTLRIQHGSPTHSCKKGDTLFLYANDTDKTTLTKSWDKFLLKNAQTEFANMIDKHWHWFENRYSEKPRFSFRPMKSRWGSCRSDGKRISINTRLFMLPPIFWEYVLAHELCHLIHHNHSADFYALQSKVFPHWKTYYTQIQQYWFVLPV